ncbi:MAG: hypothetical protein JWR02_889 [Mucilaginibacter sp.]|nr:hypothetical protein [Mucilaginibacter sp.]
MFKSIFILGLSLLFCNAADAQKNNKAVYYVMQSGALASSTANADFMLVISPPDSAAGSKLFVVREFYPNGKIRLIGTSLTKTYESLKLQGVQITFFPTGHHMRVENFKNGKAYGNIVNYYPNGKLYSIKSYMNDHKIFLKQCNDSMGKVLAENGNGKWLEFLDETFKNTYSEGEVRDGLAEGKWRDKTATGDFMYVYRNGEMVSSSNTYLRGIYTPGDTTGFKPLQGVPNFPGGVEEFGRFLAYNIRYPVVARENNIQGRIIISFVVEIDGSLTEMKIVKGIGGGCDEEALRVMRSSPKWMPAIQDGKAVRMPYSVPIAFTLSE